MRSRGGWAVNRRIALVSLMVGLAGFWLLVRPLHVPVRDNISSTVIFILGAWLTARPSAQGRFLPLARTVVPALGPVLAGLVLGSYSQISLTDVFTPAMLVVILLDVGFMALVSPYRPRRGGNRRVRVAVVGSPEATAALVAELHTQGSSGYEIVGFVHPGTDQPGRGSVPYLGNQAALATIVAVNSIDLLLASAEAPRLPLFEEIARSCLNLPVRVMELAATRARHPGSSARSTSPSRCPRWRSPPRSWRCWPCWSAATAARCSTGRPGSARAARRSRS
jgi:hypothetical protein